MSNPSSWRPRRAVPALVWLAVVTGALPVAARSEPAPIVTVEADAKGASGDIRAQVDIAAPPELVWRVLIDCAQAPRLMVGAKSCRVLRRDAGGRWDVREQISSGGLLPSIRTVLRSDYDAPRTVYFHRIDGDLKVLEGSWRLEPLDGGLGTRVIYESRVTAPFGVPAFLARSVLRKDMPRTMNNLRVACEAERARAGTIASR